MYIPPRHSIFFNQMNAREFHNKICDGEHTKQTQQATLRKIVLAI